MTVPINKWLKMLLPQTPGAVRSVVKAEFLKAVREFYEQSGCLRETVVRDVSTGVDSYVINPDTALMTTLRILNVAYDGRGLRILQRKPDRRTDPDGTPTHWYRSGVKTVVLYRIPTVDLEDGLSVYISTLPDTSTNLLPDISETDHFEALMNGTLGRLMQQPAKPYSDAVRATYHLRRFRSAIAEYKGLANKGNVPAGAGWTFNRFGK